MAYQRTQTIKGKFKVCFGLVLRRASLRHTTPAEKKIQLANFGYCLFQGCEAKSSHTVIIRTYSVASYDHAELNCGPKPFIFSNPY